MNSFLHVLKRGDTFGKESVSKSYQKHRWMFDRIYLSRMIGHFVSLMEKNTFPAPEKLFCKGILDIVVFKTEILDTMLGEEEKQSEMFHFWGPQIWKIFGGVKALRECISEGESEKLDFFVVYFLKLMAQLNKPNYKKLFIDHIIMMTYDNPTRRRRYLETMFANIESVDHKVARDEVLEMCMAILKPMLRTNGENVMNQVAKNVFLAKTIQRLFESGGGGVRDRVRNKVTAKRMDDMTSMVGLFLRSGVCNTSIKLNKWDMENATLHNVSHHQSDIGKARGFEGKTIDKIGINNSDLLNEGTYCVRRAQVRPATEEELLTDPKSPTRVSMLFEKVNQVENIDDIDEGI